MKLKYCILTAFFLFITTSFISNTWLEIAIDSELSVKFPGQPITTRKDTIHADGFEQHLVIYSYRDKSGYYRVVRDDLTHESDDYLTPQGRKEWYSVSPIVEGMIFQAKFMSRETFKINGIEGVERVYDLPPSSKNNHTLKYIRSLLVDKVAYDLWFIPSDGFANPSTKEKQLFFNSMKLQKK